MRHLGLVLGIVAVFAAVDVMADQAVVIKFSHVVASDTPKGKAADFFARKAAELTQGKVRVEVYPNSVLYKDKEELEALQLGAVQMLAPSLAKFGPLGIREFEVFDLPFIFRNYADLHKVTTGPVGKQLLGKLENKGIRGLAFWDNGFKSFSANTPIRKPDDLRGKRLRIQSSRVLEEQVRALGAVPQVMAFSEVYDALRTGVVDGTENPISNLYTQRMHEVQKHLLMTEHGYLGYAVIVNKKFWDGLPGSLRGQLEEAMVQASDYANRIAKQENDESLEKVRQSGMVQIHVPSDEELAAFRRILLPVHKQMESRIGSQTINAVYRATGFRPGQP